MAAKTRRPHPAAASRVQRFGTPQAQLEPLPRTWPQTTAAMACAAIAAPAVGNLTHNLASGVLASIGLAGAAVTRVLLGLRNDARHALHDNLTLALTNLLGKSRPDRRCVELSRWTPGREGHPRRITIRYEPSVDVANSEWEPAVTDTATRLTQVPYRITKLSRRRCVARLDISDELEQRDALPATQGRADRLVKELLGAGSSTSAFKWAGDDLTGFEADHTAGIRVAQAMFRHRIERTVSTMLPGRWRAKWDLENDEVSFERRPTMPTYVPHEVVPLTAASNKVLPYGIDEDGRPVTWSLKSSDSQPHFLVVGSTGTGKTVCINGLVMEACRRGWRVRICDPKRIEFVGLRDWPNVEIVATAVEDIVAVIESTHAEMESRYEQIETGGALDGDFEPVILVLDEYRYFYGVVNAWYSTVKLKGGSQKCPILERVFAIASLGRSAGVHLIMGTQRPDADWLGGDLRDQFAARASLGRISPQGAQMMWGAPHVGVAVPRGVPGRATGVNADGIPAEVQTFWTPDPRRHAGADGDDRNIVAALRPTSATHPQLVAVPPESRADFDPLEHEFFYNDYAKAPLEPLSDHPELARPKAISFAQHTSPSTIPAPIVSTPDPAVDDEEEGDGYQEMSQCSATSVDPGDLVCVDGDDDWAVVEDVDVDVDDDESLCIAWRNDVDDSGLLVIPADTRLHVRKPHQYEEAS